MRNSLHREIMREAAVCGRMKPREFDWPASKCARKALEDIGDHGSAIDTDSLYWGETPTLWQMIEDGLIKAERLNNRQHFLTLTKSGREALAATEG